MDGLASAQSASKRQKEVYFRVEAVREWEYKLLSSRRSTGQIGVGGVGTCMYVGREKRDRLHTPLTSLQTKEPEEHSLLRSHHPLHPTHVALHISHHFPRSGPTLTIICG